MSRKIIKSSLNEEEFVRWEQIKDYICEPNDSKAIKKCAELAVSFIKEKVDFVPNQVLDVLLLRRKYKHKASKPTIENGID